MNSNQFLVMIACLLCLALGAIALSQVSQDADATASVQVGDTNEVSTPDSTPVRL